jgi:hypothetical protein
MRYPRSRAIHAAGFVIPIAMLAALLLLFVRGSVQAQVSLPAGQSPPGSPETPWDYPVCFTGQDHVDLKWGIDPWYTTYVIMRDGAELKRFSTTVTFYRDRSVAKGETYTYQICAQHESDPPSCGLSSTTTVGQIRGTLYDSVYWPGDDYQLAGHVDLGPAATLNIGPGATVVGSTATTEINDQNQGVIQVDGATIQAKLVLQSGWSWVEGSTIGGDAFGAVVLSQWGGTEFAGNTFTSTSLLQISVGLVQMVTVNDNRFYASQVSAGGSGDVYIDGNRFEKGSEVLLEDSVNGGASGNTFYDSWVQVSTTGNTVIEGNRMRLLDPDLAGSITLIEVYSPAPNATVLGNLLDGLMDGAYGTGTGIVAGAWPDGSGDVGITGNIVTELERGISVQGPVDASISNNTITHNQTGIYVRGVPGVTDPTVAVYANCIGSNLRSGSAEYGGLTTFRRTQPLGATGNYWGDPTGPTHPDNPGGQGDRIQELDENWNPAPGLVNFEGWLPGHHCNEADLSVAGLEVVQSIQDLNNSVPLVAGKPTVLRIYADSGMAPEVGGVPVEVKAYRDGSLLGSKQGTLTARPLVDWDWVRAGDEGGLGIRLDGAWLSGTVTLTVELNAQHTISESTFSNNQVTYTLGFKERKPLHIGLAPIEYRPDPGVEPRMVPTAELPSLVQFLHKTYPVSEVRVSLLPPVWWPYRMMGNPNEEQQGLALLKELTWLWGWYRANAEPGQGVDQVAGVFPAECDAGGDITLSSASDPRWFGGKGVASFLCSGSGSELAHVVAHNLGLYHPCNPELIADCCGAGHGYLPGMPPQDWPYADASIQEYGFDSIENAVVLRTTPDLMTWCGPRWLSPHNYNKLYKANGVPQPPAGGSGGNPPLAATDYLLAGGLVYTDGVVSFDPFWQITSAEPPLDPPEGSDYCLELQDVAHTVLYSRCLDLPFFDYERGQATGVDGFLVDMPLDPSASRVVLKQGATELGAVEASANIPTVTVLAPKTAALQSEHMTVSWTATDADPGDELAFVLSYSNDDGATWLPFALNLTGTTSFDLDLSNVPGGAACQVQVEVSDGWHTADDTSESFAVADKAPLAGILEPADGAVVATPLTLQGYGYDLEDGQLDGTSLAWSSDRDGPLGTGDTLWDVDLTPGQHTLTLQVTDSQGHTAMAAVVITVSGGEPGLKHIYLPLVLRQY